MEGGVGSGIKGTEGREGSHLEQSSAICNSVAISAQTFPKRLKTEMFQRSYNTWLPVFSDSVFCSVTLKFLVMPR